jgi:hypothetical protein
MTLDEAIKTIKEELGEHTPHRDTDFYKACELGTEALKQVRVYRAIYPLSTNDKLPGETEE